MFNHFIGRSVFANPVAKKKATGLRGWKRNELYILDDGRVQFKSLAFDLFSKVEADAVCTSNEDLENNLKAYEYNKVEEHLITFLVDHHKIPSKICTCGFYAYESRSGAEFHAQPNSFYGTDTSVLMEVAISGKFIQYQKGYRYAHQRITKVIVGKCVSADGCLEQATLFSGLSTSEGTRLYPSCLKHSKMVKFSFAEVDEKLASQSLNSKFAPLTLETANGEEPWVPTPLENSINAVAKKAKKVDVFAVVICTVFTSVMAALGVVVVEAITSGL